MVNYRLMCLLKLGEKIWHRYLFGELVPEDHFDWATYLVSHQVCDPVLLSRKAEGRAVGKSPRLVSMVSVVDALVARIIYTNHLITEQSHDSIATATKLDLTTPEETAKMFELFSSKGKLVSNDVQGFEFSLDEYDHLAALVKKAYCSGVITITATGEIVILRHVHFFTMVGITFSEVYKLCQLPEGEFVIVPPGVQSSGKLTTYSDNSFIRAWLSNVISWETTGKGISFIKTAGDDALDDNLKATPGHYLKYGKVITDHVIQEGEYTFCSTNFASSGCYQENIKKAAYQIISRGSFDFAAFSSFDLSFSRHPQYEKFKSILNKFASGEREAKAMRSSGEISS